jgi:hypothetical protein
MKIDIEWLTENEPEQRTDLFYCEGYHHSPVCIITGNTRKVLISCDGEMTIRHQHLGQEYVIKDFWDLLDLNITKDIDLNVFRQQIARIGPGHVSIFIANNDRALSLSSRIAGDRPRVGALDPSKAEDKSELDRLGVSVQDISSFSTDFVGHGAFSEAPDVVKKIGGQLTAPRADDANKHAIIYTQPGEPVRRNPNVETKELPPLPAQ